MSILGRGLSSLIPRRAAEDAEDIIEQIDSMEEVDARSVPVENVEEESAFAKATADETEIIAPQKRISIQDGDAETEVAETPETEEPTPIVEEPAAPEVPEVTPPVAKQSQGLEDFEDLSEMEAMPMPAKPLVTPLQLDPETGTLRDPALIAQEHQAKMMPKHVRASEIVQRTKAKRMVIKPLTMENEEEGKSEEVVTAEVETVTVTSEVYTGDEPVEEPEKTADDLDDDVEETEEDEAVEAILAKEPVVATKKGRVENEVWDRHEEKVELVSIGDIQVNPNQPRRTFNPEELDELKQSIDQHGILQPLVVVRKGDSYELVAGERRLRAAKLLNWDKVPCVVRTDIYTDRNSLELALIENIQRENLNPIEEAMGYKLLNEEYGMSHEEIGQRVGRSRVNITNVIRILQLPPEIQRGLIEGKLTVGHARAILMIPDEEKQLRFYHHMLEEGLTVRKAETRARRIQRQLKINDPMRKKTRGRPQLALKYDGVLEERYGHTARVKFNETKNRFEVFFFAFSEAEAEELINRLLGSQQPLEYPEDKDEA